MARLDEIKRIEADIRAMVDNGKVSHQVRLMGQDAQKGRKAVIKHGVIEPNAIDHQRFPENGAPAFPGATERLFEIPWNKDPGLITRIKGSPFKDKVKFVYMPCVYTHGLSTRHTDPRIMLDREDFEKAAKHVQNTGYEPCVLMQRKFKLEYLPYYYEMGIRYFTVGEDHVAIALREKYGEKVYITASITKDLIEEDFRMYEEKYPGLYDVFILRHGYSRDIEAITELPRSMKYGLTVNDSCLWDCPSYRRHWFPWEDQDSAPPRSTYCEEVRRKDPSRKVAINPEDLWLFDQYITSYKLVMRTDRSSIIYNALEELASVNVDSDRVPKEEREATFKRYNVGHGILKRTAAPIY